jgi:hypothetical protein
MVFANRTYLDSLNRYIVLRYYKALLGISERSMVSTEPLTIQPIEGRSQNPIQGHKHHHHSVWTISMYNNNMDYFKQGVTSDRSARLGATFHHSSS